jgi:predicted CoA-binding protein
MGAVASRIVTPQGWAGSAPAKGADVSTRTTWRTGQRAASSGPRCGLSSSPPRPCIVSVMAILDTWSDIAHALTRSRRLAVLGAHHEPARAACYVPEYLARHGYQIVPVNPRLVGMTLWGEAVRRSLAEAESVDMVVCFRRSDDLPHHLPEILSMRPRPAIVWQQLGIANRAFSNSLVAAGLDVVEDRCTLQDHRLLGLAVRSPGA